MVSRKTGDTIHGDQEEPKTRVDRQPGESWDPMPQHVQLFHQTVLDLEEAQRLGIGVSKILHERIEPGGAVLPHYHDVAEVIYFLHGEVHALVNGEWQQCGVGDALIVPHRVVHSVENRGSEATSQLSSFLPAVNGFSFDTVVTGEHDSCEVPSVLAF